MTDKSKHLAKVERALARFERAVEEKAFEGEIPIFSSDREEQMLLDAAHKKIAANYARARAALLRLFPQ